MRQSIKDKLSTHIDVSSTSIGPSIEEMQRIDSETLLDKADYNYVSVEQYSEDVENLVRIGRSLDAIEAQQPLDVRDNVTKACMNAVVAEIGLESSEVVADIKETIRRIWRAIETAIRKGIRQIKIWLKTLLDGTEKFKDRVDTLSEKLTTLSTTPKDDKVITAPLIAGVLDIEGEVSPLLIKSRLSLVTPLFNKQMVGNVEAITSMITGMAKIDPRDIKDTSVYDDAIEVRDKVNIVLGGIVLSKKKLPVRDSIIQTIFPTFLPKRPVVSDMFEFVTAATQIHSTETLPGNMAFYVLSSKLIGKHDRIKVKSSALNMTARLGSLSLINTGVKLTENKLPVLAHSDMVDLCNFVSTTLDDVIYFNKYYTKRSLKSSEAMFDEVNKLSDAIYDNVKDKEQAFESRMVFKVISELSREIYQLSESLTLSTVRYTVKTCRAITKYVEASAARYDTGLDESTLLESK